MTRFRELLPYVLRQWRWLVAILLLSILSSAASALQPWPMKLLVDYALDEAKSSASQPIVPGIAAFTSSPAALVIFAALASLVLFALTSALGVGLSVSWNVAGHHIAYGLAADLFARLQRLSLQYHSRRTVGDSRSRIMVDIWCVAPLADGVFLVPLQEAVVLLSTVCVGL